MQRSRNEKKRDASTLPRVTRYSARTPTGPMVVEDSLPMLRTMFALVLSLVSMTAFAAPNILVFVGDDVDWRDVGALGNSTIHTPNLDALVARGLVCTNAFLTTPQCSPSRISILSGRYPHATGTEDLHMPLPDGIRIVPSYLRDAGYFTGHMAKTHYGPNGNAQFDWYDRELDDFAAFLDKADAQPFFMWVGFRDAHRPYEAGAFTPPHDPAQVIVPPYLVDTPETRVDLALYYDEIARMDADIGGMLAELDRRGKTADTLVLYIGDNGSPFPRAKGTLYDSGIGTPFIAAWPDRIPAGRTYDGLISAIDLAPTFLEAAASAIDPIAAGMQGASILALLRNAEGPGRDYAFSERNWHDCDEHLRSVRTPQYKLIRNAYLDQPHGTPTDLFRSPSHAALRAGLSAGTLTRAQAMLFDAPRPRIELYDLVNDPWETKNLAETDAGKPIAKELESVLDDWIAATGDFAPKFRRRADEMDRVTGVMLSTDVPPMTNLRPGEAPPPVRRRP